MSLFDYHTKEHLKKDAPLASRMRPRNFDEFVGQEHIVGDGRVLRKSIEEDLLPSMILWGPPGSGKTTLAHLITTLTKSHSESISAVASGVAELRQIVRDSEDRIGMHSQHTILFIDEIHRFNKAQQDVILPHVESGIITLIGATTENPSFEINSPLLSRTSVFILKELTTEQIETLIQMATEDVERGLGNLNLKLDKEALEWLARISNGDARVALNSLEIVVHNIEPDKSGTRIINSAIVQETTQKRLPRYDKTGAQHYDTISAFIKSLRSSDPDAALYYLARMIKSGEDPLFIARRLVIQAAEDVGMADPQALVVAVAAQQAVHLIGLPEGRIPLAEATVYVASAPKSNSTYNGINKAIKDVENTPNDPIPLHLRNPVTELMHDLGYGHGYKHAHDYGDGFTVTQNLPDSLKNRRYYTPSKQGYEKEIFERLRSWRGQQKL